MRVNESIFTFAFINVHSKKKKVKSAVNEARIPHRSILSRNDVLLITPSYVCVCVCVVVDGNTSSNKIFSLRCDESIIGERVKRQFVNLR